MNLKITENQLQKVIEQTIENEGLKSEAIYIPEVTPFKLKIWEIKGLKPYLFNKESVELKPIEKYGDIAKIDMNKKSWSANHLLLLTNEDYDKFNRLTTNVKKRIELEEQKIKLIKEHTQSVIYQHFKKID